MDRLTSDFTRHGADGRTDVELLELLLRYCSDHARELAHTLLEHFGSMAAIMEATKNDLEAVGNITDEEVRLLQLIPAFHRRHILSRSREETRLTDSTEFGNYLLPYFHGARDELVYLLCLDGVGKVLRCTLLGHGSVNSANVPMRRLAEEAIHANASVVVLAHNHPSGVALPSKEDVELTLRLRDALDVMEITLIDHILVADDDFVSLRESGYLRRF